MRSAIFFTFLHFGTEMGCLLHLNMNDNAHIRQLVDQLRRIFLIPWYGYDDFVHPFPAKNLQNRLAVRGDGNSQHLLASLIHIQQADAGQQITGHRFLCVAGNQLVHTVGCADKIQRRVRLLWTSRKKTLPSQPHAVGKDAVIDGKAHQHHSGIVAAPFRGEHVKNGQQLYQNDVLHRLGKFPVIAPPQNVFHGLPHDQSHKIHQRQHNGEVAIAVAAVGPDRPVSGYPGSQEGQMKAQDIQQQEIPVFHPALHILLIHIPFPFSLFAESGIVS